jgi:hypothetical protein
MSKIIIVGGDYGVPRESKIIQTLGETLNADVIHNGGTIERLKHIKTNGYDLIIWMPNVPNQEDKVYPKKDKGAVLICSKNLTGNLREPRTDHHRTEVDAVSRIFTMKGNAVIAISTSQATHTRISSTYILQFKLIDALGNVWIDSEHTKELANGIKAFYEWTANSTRVESKPLYEHDDMMQLLEINKQIADRLEKERGRYFGNLSTRCFKLFPSGRQQNWILVSRRNVDKKRLTIEDMVPTVLNAGRINYLGFNKPSVDTPIQMGLYNRFRDINYMIHGHAYIADGAPTTEHYFPCGDLRELSEITSLIETTKDQNKGAINLINHGFLIYSQNINELQIIADNVKLINRKVGIEKA